MNTPRDSARLFFALLPDAQATAAIEYHARQYSPGTGRKVSPENYHITLLFLGNVGRQHIDALCQACEGLALPAFTLDITTPGWWKKAGILWLAPEQVPTALTGLHERLAGIAAQRHIACEKRDYIPHITLMRKVVTAPQYPLVKPFTWQAREFSLMQSVTRPDGVQYQELASWPLVP